MKRNGKVLGILLLVLLIIGCSNANTNEQETKYYIIQNGKKTYFKNYEFTKDIPNFDSILIRTIKSLNEIKDGKRDLEFIKGIESEDLKKDEAHKVFSMTIPGDSELKIKKADIKSYNITGLQYNKEQNFIKVFISIETNEQQDNRSINVLNNQTYIYNFDYNTLQLTKYNLSQYLQ